MWVRPLNRLTFTRPQGQTDEPGRALRACADKLASVFTDIFNLSLTQYIIPTCFKQTTIVSVPKNAMVTCLNDYRSVEHVCSHEVLWKAGYDSHQHHHPRHPGPTPIHIPPQQIHRWFHLYFTPHCPIPPGQEEHLFKNAVHWPQLGDTTTVGLITNDDETAYWEEVNDLAVWVPGQQLLPQRQQDKGADRGIPSTSPFTLWSWSSGMGQVERVQSFKFLGVHITKDLSWLTHTNIAVKRLRQRLFPSQEAEPISHGSSDPPKVLQLHHWEHLDWLHHHL
jgi:hypothetical protein